MLIEDYHNHMPNTPAANQWTLLFQYTQIYGAVPYSSILPVTFLPNGSVDFTRTSETEWKALNRLLEPLIVYIEDGGAMFNVKWDYWKLINWWFVSLYWGILVDLGQDDVTIYPPSTQSGRGFYPPDFLRATYYPSTNNIFVNNTLFTIYSDILRNQIFPLINTTWAKTSVSAFAPLDNQNRYTPVRRGFQRSYSCVIRKWKAPLTAIISVVVAFYALFKGGYALFISVAERFQKRRDEMSIHLNFIDTNSQQIIARDVYIIGRLEI